MGACRTAHSAGKARRGQAPHRDACGDERRDVHPEYRLPVALSSEGFSAAQYGPQLLRLVAVRPRPRSHSSRALRRMPRTSGTRSHPHRRYHRQPKREEPRKRGACITPPSKIRGRAELGLYLRRNTASTPSSTSWRLVRSIVAMLVSSATAIRLSLQPSPSSDTSAFSRMRAFVSSWAERLPLRINSLSWARSSALNRTTYFFTAISFQTTNHLHRCLAATEIQTLPSFSMTGATSLRYDLTTKAPLYAT